MPAKKSVSKKRHSTTTHHKSSVTDKHEEAPMDEETPSKARKSDFVRYRNDSNQPLIVNCQKQVFHIQPNSMAVFTHDEATSAELQSHIVAGRLRPVA